MDKTERYDSWALYKQVQYLATMLQQEYKIETFDDVVANAWEVCACHEWATCYYPALRVVAENDTTDAEDVLAHSEQEFLCIGDHACAVVRELLFDAVLAELEERGECQFFAKLGDEI